MHAHHPHFLSNKTKLIVTLLLQVMYMEILMQGEAEFHESLSSQIQAMDCWPLRLAHLVMSMLRLKPEGRPEAASVNQELQILEV